MNGTEPTLKLAGVPGQTLDFYVRQQHAVSSVLEERCRQVKKWGDQHHDNLEWFAILVEEVGELGKECIEQHFSGEKRANLKTELQQVAAVALAWIEDLHRKEE